MFQFRLKFFDLRLYFGDIPGGDSEFVEGLHNLSFPSIDVSDGVDQVDTTRLVIGVFRHHSLGFDKVYLLLFLLGQGVLGYCFWPQGGLSVLGWAGLRFVGATLLSFLLFF